MKDILQAYLKRLTNLSGNNRSLLLHRLIRDQFIDLNDLAYIDGKPAWRILEEVIIQKTSVKLAPLSDPRDPNSNKKAGLLKRLAKKEEFIFQESGARDLYVGWPFVTGKFNDDTLVRAPLCFFPVALEVEKGYWVLQPKSEVSVGLNKSFLLIKSIELIYDSESNTIEKVGIKMAIPNTSSNIPAKRKIVRKNNPFLCLLEIILFKLLK